MVSELDPQRVLGAPDDPARSTVAEGGAQSEFIGDRGGSDPRKFRAAVREVDQDARTLQVPASIVDRGGHVPPEPEVLAPVPPRRPVQMAGHSRTLQVAHFFCVGADAQFRVKSGGSLRRMRRRAGGQQVASAGAERKLE